MDSKPVQLHWLEPGEPFPSVDETWSKNSEAPGLLAAGGCLDVETLRALEDALLEFAGCVLVISHDRWFLDRIATHILAFEGDSKVEFFNGNYQEYEEDKRKRLGEEGAKPKRIRYKPLK